MGLSGWQYCANINIDNTGNSNALSDYQQKIVLSSSNFDFSKANSDGSDIRFLDSDDSTPLSYWIESWDSSGQTATIWVKVPSIPASSNYTIYMYFGNASATKADNLNSATLKFQLTNDNNGIADTTEDKFWWSDGTFLGSCSDSSPDSNTFTDCSFDVTTLAQNGITNSYVYWNYYSGLDTGHVRNMRIEVDVSGTIFTFWDQYGNTTNINTGVDNDIGMVAFDGSGNAAQLDLNDFKNGVYTFVGSGTYAEHYFNYTSIIDSNGVRDYNSPEPTTSVGTIRTVSNAIFFGCNF